MSDRDLTIAQRSVLLTLMIKNAPVSNQYLRNNGISLDLGKRKDLKERELITVAESPLIFTLTDKGWSEGKKEMAAATPSRAGAMGGTLYLLLNFLHSYFERNELSAPEFFGGSAATPAVGTEAAIQVDDSDLETRIRKAYAVLAPRSGEYIMLDDLRRGLSGAAKATVDEALRVLDRSVDVHLVPESNQKALTASQRAAAVRIGRQDMHLIAIGS